MTVGLSYLLSFVMKHFGMTTMDDTPKHKLIPDNVKRLHRARKEEITSGIMDELVAQLFLPFEDNSKVFTLILYFYSTYLITMIMYQEH